MPLPFKPRFIVFVFAALSCTSPCFGQTPQQTPLPDVEQRNLAQRSAEQNNPAPDRTAPHTEQPNGSPAGAPMPDQQLPGSISGTVGDRSGAVVAGARVRLTRDEQTQHPSSSAQAVPGQAPKDQSAKDQFQSPEAVSGGDGQFFFASVPPGPFQLTITAAGFATQTSSGILHSGEIQTVPPIALEVATAVTEVQVQLTRTEVAEQEIKIEEKQRVLGVIPNFYVSYIPDAVPLNSRQKFSLAWKTVIDPVTILLVGATAGVEQAENHFSGYGQGAQGYAKRFGAGYADTVAGTFVGAAILPSLLKQDPRYFYKGTGSISSRALYAIANSVICKGDNGHWQTNYSNILGSLAAGGISNLYYPADDRDGAELTFANAAIGLGATAIANLFQEFVIRKVTPKVPNRNAPNP
jgi:Carboxypeptidase regulatory-like domain